MHRDVRTWPSKFLERGPRLNFSSIATKKKGKPYLDWVFAAGTSLGVCAVDRTKTCRNFHELRLYARCLDVEEFSKLRSL